MSKVNPNKLPFGLATQAERITLFSREDNERFYFVVILAGQKHNAKLELKEIY